MDADFLRNTAASDSLWIMYGDFKKGDNPGVVLIEELANYLLRTILRPKKSGNVSV